MKKKFVMAFIIGILLLIGIETAVYFINKPKYILHLPTVEKLTSIHIENKKIETPEDMQEILNVLNKEGRTTKEESIQDSPVNVEEILKVDFYFIESGISTLFVYKRNNAYYIEQPYNGIYKITKEEYKKIKKICYNV